MNKLTGLTLMSAISENRIIGKDGGMPGWHLRDDFKHFRKKTMGHNMVMGRKTCISLGSPLEGRIKHVLTRDREFSAPGFRVIYSPEYIYAMAKSEEVFVIGGEEIYRLFLPQTSRMVITYVAGVFDGDTYFPNVDYTEWGGKILQTQSADERNTHAFTIVEYIRRPAPPR